MRIDTEVNADGPLGFPGVEDDDEWFDPVVGAELILGSPQGTSFSFRGDIGGCDVGEASRLRWQLQAILNVGLAERSSLVLGNRFFRIRLGQRQQFEHRW